MGRVIVYGSINADTTVEVADFPAPGETIHATGARSGPGGKGLNQAVAAARMGVRTHMVGAIGTDPAGVAMREDLAEEAGLDHSAVKSVDGPTGQAFITVEGSGENHIVIVAGANGTHSAQTAREDLDFLERGDLLVCQLEIPSDAVAAALVLARDRGATTVLNAAPAAAAVTLLGDVDLLVVNETEAATILAESGRAPIDDPADAAAHLHASTGAVVVITLGADGLVYAAGDDAGALPAHAVSPVDTTGAGDAFVGALAAGLAEGRPLRSALRFATALGALACTAAGAQGYTATRADVIEIATP